MATGWDFRIFLLFFFYYYCARPIAPFPLWLPVLSWLVIAADVTTIKGKYPTPWRLSSTV